MRLISITEDTLEAFRPYIVQSQFRHAKEGNVRGVGLAEGSTTFGAALARDCGEEWELLSLYVDPKMRGKGGGKLLLDTTKLLAQKSGGEILLADYLFDDITETKKIGNWLDVNGFGKPEIKALHYDGRTKRVLEARKLRNAPVTGRGIFPLAQVPGTVINAFCKEWDVPRLMRPDGMDGVPDREHSLCCFEGEILRGYVLFTILEGTLYMGAACFAPGYPMCVYRTIRTAVAKAFRDFPALPVHISAIHPVAAGMIEQLSDGLYDLRSEEWRSVCELNEDIPANEREPAWEPCGLWRAAQRVLDAGSAGAPGAIP